MKKIVFVLSVLVNGYVLFAQEDTSELVNLNEDLLLHYSFDGNIEDSSNDNHHGVSYGDIEYTTDRFGNTNHALSFDGVNDFIEFPNLNVLKPELPVTISFDIKYQSYDVTERVVFNTSYKDDYNSGVFFTSQSTTGKYAIGFGDGDYNYTSGSRRSFVGESTIENDAWHFLTVVVNSSLNMQLYVDGVEVLGEYSGTGGDLSYSDSPGVIGKHDQSVALGAYFFKGEIDDFRYWNKAFSGNEVSYLYNSFINQEKLTTESQITTNPGISIVYKGAQLFINSEQRITKVEVFDILGKRIFMGHLTTVVNTDGFTSGVFIVKVQNESGEVFVKKIGI